MAYQQQQGVPPPPQSSPTSVLQQGSQTNHNLVHCPTIVNLSPHIITVFQERGFLYNKQTLEPGEVLNITRMETGAVIVPYQIHVVVGDERNIPHSGNTFQDKSTRNLIKASAIPIAFCVGTFMAASSAGALTGASAAMANMAKGVVIRGMVIDKAALAAGTVMASRVQFLSEFLVKKHPENFISKTKSLRAGKRVVVVTGGVDSPIKIDVNVPERDYRKMNIRGYKTPTETLTDQISYYMPGLLPTGGGGKQPQQQQKQLKQGNAGRGSLRGSGSGNGSGTTTYNQGRVVVEELEEDDAEEEYKQQQAQLREQQEAMEFLERQHAEMKFYEEQAKAGGGGAQTRNDLETQNEQPKRRSFFGFGAKK